MPLSFNKLTNHHTNCHTMMDTNLRWSWYTKCKSWGSHKVTSCRSTLNHSSRSSSKQAYLARKFANKGYPINVDSVALSESGSDSDNISIASNSAFLGSKDIKE
eukprot:1042981-Ditylum_brightwellii.AAC.1